MIEQICKEGMCYGCTACQHICPVKAIEMNRNREGFLYASVIADKCIECGLCKRVCPVNSQKNLKNSLVDQNYYAARCLHQETLKESTSGGLFSVLSDYVINKGGTVYGAVFSDKMIVVHGSADTVSERNKQRGTKYVQSELGDIFLEIKSKLQDMEHVFFCGTPCQAAGLKSYLTAGNVSIENLILCDFICHGVGSPKIWREYVKKIEKDYHCKITEFSFRDKSNGWNNSSVKVVMGNQDVTSRDVNANSFSNIYRSLLINRLCCYKCQFTSYERVSDITLADFWNVGKFFPEMNDEKGVSQVLINTKKGMELFNNCKEKLCFNACHKEQCWQPHLEYANELPHKRKQFWDQYYQNGYEYVLKKYGKGSFMQKMKVTLVPYVKRLGLYELAGKVYKILFVRK